MAKERRMKILGHRGSRGTHPENTLASFAEAVAAGADGIELDVQFSADRVGVVYHDPKIGSKHCLLNGKKPRKTTVIAEVDLPTIKQYDCGATFQPLFPRQKLQKLSPTPILTLEEFFAWAKAHAPKLEWVVELKMPPRSQKTVPDRAQFARATCDLIRHYRIEKRVVLQSFDHALLQECRTELPQVTRSHLFHSEKNFPDLAAQHGASRVSPNFRLLNPKTMGRCKELGLVVTPYTVNRAASWRQALQFGVDALITDYPRKLATWMDRLR
ncbi:MAG: hypothetical protein KDD51_13590 [Bdellovibrionales bacterium]|nr:hypothetical protein [Bdellovibrionales bacterium]